jgi:hypothetical protein
MISRTRIGCCECADFDTGPEWRLEKIRIGSRDAVPPQGMEESSEVAGRVEALGSEMLPPLLFDDRTVQLIIPEHVKGLALRIVVRASQAYDG